MKQLLLYCVLAGLLLFSAYADRPYDVIIVGGGTSGCAPGRSDLRQPRY